MTKSKHPFSCSRWVLRLDKSTCFNRC